VFRLLLVCFFLLAALAAAQSVPSTVSGTVITDDGVPLPNVSVRWNQQGQSFAVATDSLGKFSFDFSEAGMRKLQFEHPSTVVTGIYDATLSENASIDLSVVLHRDDGSGGNDSWSIKRQYGKPPAMISAERLISLESMNAQPGTESLWSFLNMSEPSVVADRFDISGMHSYRQLLLGVRGSSWTQNQALVNGIAITNPSGEGMLAFPDMSAMDSVIYSVGTSSTKYTGPGGHIDLISKVGTAQPHGQVRMAFQSGALQNANVIGRYREFGFTESDERWKHFFNGGFQLGGPLGQSRWTYFTAISARDAEKRIRNHPLPVSGAVLQETFNAAGAWSSQDRLIFHSSMQQRRDPQAEASPQVTRDSSVRQTQTYRQAQGIWTHAFSSGDLLDVRAGAAISHLNSRFQPGVTGQSEEDLFPGYVVDSVFPRLLKDGELYDMMRNTRRGPAPLVTSSDTDVWEAAVNYSAVRNVLGVDHRVSSGVSFNHSFVAQRDDAMDGLNLLFFYQSPYAVRMLNTPSRTHDRIRQGELYVSDTFSLSRLSFSAGASADVSQGANLLQSGQSVNQVRWVNVGANLGAALQVTERRPLGRASCGRTHLRSPHNECVERRQP
jgi:hypothetical protein